MLEILNKDGSLTTRLINRRTFYTGDVIFNEGDKGSHSFVVQSGRVRIVKNLPGGGKGTLGFVEKGGIFGEMALIDNSPRMATAIAAEPTCCIVITEDQLKSKLRRADPLLRMLLTVMIRMGRTLADRTPIPEEDIEGLAEAAKWLPVEEARAKGKRRFQ